MKLYIAGPMTGLPYYNSKAFDQVADTFRAFGLYDEIFNPAEEDRKDYGFDFFERCPKGTEAVANGFDFRKTLAKDLQWICEHATHIYMLRGWEKSKGARAEHATALTLGLEIMYE